MPCPFFEPTKPAERPEHVNARLPLIEEFDGVCHAAGACTAIAPEARFRYCNHGNSNGDCGRFPAGEPSSSWRYEMARRSPEICEVLVIEERLFAPQSWHRIEFSRETGRLNPEVADVCQRSQLIAFCGSWLRVYGE